MSADLLAEFGSPASTLSKSGRTVQAKEEAQSSDERTLLRAEVPARPQDSAYASRASIPPRLLPDDDEAHGTVLFDADLDLASNSDEDDFGEFEAAAFDKTQTNQTDSTSSAQPEMISTLSLIDTEENFDLQSATNSTKAARAGEFPAQNDEWGDFNTPQGQGVHQVSETISKATSNPDTLLGLAQSEDPEFKHTDTGPALRQRENSPNHTVIPLQPTHAAKLPPQSTDNCQGQGDLTGAKSDRSSIAGDLRPTYIPPPSVLLGILPRIYSIVAKASEHEPSRLVANNVLNAYRVSGRLIAGRSLRWKRDHLLSQSMKIGPAATTGKGGGMKLTAMSKSETLQEDREVADVIQAWSQHAQLLNSIVAKAGYRQPGMRLSQGMRPRTTPSTVASASQNACALCGLKRSERISEIDVEAEDSFGEFWVEHWGHTDCQTFWYMHKDFLPHR